MKHSAATTGRERTEVPNVVSGAERGQASVGRKYVKWSTCQEVMAEEYDFLSELAKR